MKVVIYHDYPESLVNQLREKYTSFEFVVARNRKEMEKEIADAEILMSFKCDINILDLGKNLKWIQLLRAGADGVPFEEIKRRGIILTNGRGVHKIHMAEYAIASMIMLARNWASMFHNQVEGKWDRSPAQYEINGATVGILGLGSIGSEIAKRAKAFGMKVIGTRKKQEPVEYVDELYRPDQMNEIFKKSDYIINLLPSTEETRAMINADYFNLLRGSTVNEEDMIKALESGKIRGAVLDVFEKEPLAKDSPLWKLKNVILTPHICGESHGKYEEKALEVIEHNLKAYKENIADMINIVDPDKGY
jgi:D-2-hydroxyacid dehydrogenase (NADP+)